MAQRKASYQLKGDIFGIRDSYRNFSCLYPSSNILASNFFSKFRADDNLRPRHGRDVDVLRGSQYRLTAAHKPIAALNLPLHKLFFSGGSGNEMNDKLFKISY